MIGEHSLYRKIQAVLEVAKKGTTSSKDELFKEVFAKNLINFLYRRMDKTTEEEEAHQSPQSIRKTVEICFNLGLIRDKGTLTPIGIKALSPHDFDGILGKLIVKFIESHGVTIQVIEKEIIDLLHSSPPILPTAKALWEALDQPLKLDDFSVMLTLLAHCGRIISARNKIYIGFYK